MAEKITHRQLCEAGAKWLTKAVSWKFRSPYSLVEFCSTANENPDIFGLRGSHSILVEVKVSKSDFKADKKKRANEFGRIGLTRYYLVPDNLITIEDITNDWGLIYYDGKNFTIIRESPAFEDRNYMSELNLLQSVIRRLAGTKKVLDFRVEK